MVNPDLEKEELARLDNHKQRCDALLKDIYKKWVKRCTQNEENRAKNLNSQWSIQMKDLFLRTIELKKQYDG